ncbi:hypothetical protein [Hoeflea alexandrii]|nr:hypothetical protein [Hoeflea alexandrii]MCZ4287560.1 hypothetical protein [Hoeflea alexandrii]
MMQAKRKQFEPDSIVALEAEKPLARTHVSHDVRSCCGTQGA